MNLQEFLSGERSDRKRTVLEWVEETFWWPVERVLKNTKYWFLYRFHPKYRYHVLRLHEPNYCDPRHQMIYAVMGITYRYLDELSRHTTFPDFSYRVVVQEWIEFYKTAETEESERLGRELDFSDWINHFNDLIVLLDWWEKYKDYSDLDGHSKEEWKYLKDVVKLTQEEFDNCSTEKVDEMMKLAIDLRVGMWT